LDNKKISWIIVATSTLVDISVGFSMIFLPYNGMFFMGVFLITVGIVSHCMVYILPLEDKYKVYFPNDGSNKHVCVDGSWYVKTNFLDHIRDREGEEVEIGLDDDVDERGLET
jgi:hypothetical protein